MAEATTPSPTASGTLTVKEVRDVIQELNQYDRYNEVYPRIVIGGESFIRSKETLQTLGITHVLNAAEGNKTHQVDTGEVFYTDTGITYMGVKALDVQDFKLSPYFRPAADFIHTALQDGGKVAVNCFMGFSRSVSLVLAYLMLYKAFPLVEAIRTIVAKRQIHPNDGFLQQLIDLDNQLKPTRNNSNQTDQKRF